MTDIDELTHLFDRMASEAPEPITLPCGTEGKIRGARLRRYASIGLVAVLVAAGIILPLKALLPLADRDKPTVRPAGPGTDVRPSDSFWPSAPPITEEMLGLPKDWNGLTGQALAEHLGLELTPQGSCKSAWTQTQGTVGWCLANAGPLTATQEMGLAMLLRNESFSDPVWQSRLATAANSDARTTGDLALAADLNWMYVWRPRLLDTSDGGPIVTPPKAITPAQPGQDTYVFSNIEFTYPYVPGGAKGATPDPGFATLRLSSDWSGDTYPGKADCQVRFVAADGSDVGGWTGGWSQAPRHVDWGYGTKGGAPDGALGVWPVTGVPVRTTWACSAGTKPADGVTIDNLTLERHDGHLQMSGIFRVPPTDGGSGPQVCEIEAIAADGTALTASAGTIEAPDGQTIHVGVPDTFEGATNLQASCRPFTGRGG